MTTQFKGTGVALVTPFTSDLEVDHAALGQLVEDVITGGVDYLVVLGTTGESATLSSREKHDILRTVARIAGGRVPLVAGIGGNNTYGVVEELKKADLQGYSAILSVSPYYNRPAQEGIFRHFKTLAAASPLPLILYNVPARTGSNVLPDTVIRLAQESPKIIGIKEASGDIAQIRDLIENTPDGFLVISGDDLTAVPVILQGGAGVISVLAQGIPAVFSEMIRRAGEGQAEAALQLHNQLLPMVDLLFREGNPAGIKGLLECRGVCTSSVRLPLIPPSRELVGAIKAFLKDELPTL